jgi:hypothetical protein
LLQCKETRKGPHRRKGKGKEGAMRQVHVSVLARRQHPDYPRGEQPGDRADLWKSSQKRGIAISLEHVSIRKAALFFGRNGKKPSQKFANIWSKNMPQMAPSTKSRKMGQKSAVFFFLICGYFSSWNFFLRLFFAAIFS